MLLMYIGAKLYTDLYMYKYIKLYILLFCMLENVEQWLCSREKKDPYCVLHAKSMINELELVSLAQIAEFLARGKACNGKWQPRRAWGAQQGGKESSRCHAETKQRVLG